MLRHPVFSEAIFFKIKHVLVLGVQKSLDRLTMWPIVTGCFVRIKEVINQLTGLRGQYCSLQRGTVQPLTALGADWESTALLPHAAADNMGPKQLHIKGNV